MKVTNAGTARDECQMMEQCWSYAFVLICVADDKGDVAMPDIAPEDLRCACGRPQMKAPSVARRGASRREVKTPRTRLSSASETPEYARRSDSLNPDNEKPRRATPGLRAAVMARDAVRGRYSALPTVRSAVHGSDPSLFYLVNLLDCG